MTDQAIRIAVAEACGWTDVAVFSDGSVNGYHGNRVGHKREVPNYLFDLNACADMEATLSPAEEAGYFLELQKLIVPPYLKHFAPCIRATARQKCEAFLRAKWLWKDYSHV